MKILAIETSCDETALALVEARGGLRNPKFKILKNLVASQIKIHRPFGGIVPSLAKREHLKNLPILFNKILKAKSLKLKVDIDLIAVTVGPGLEPCLWTGINFAKELKAKLIGVNHLEGHLYSFLLRQKRVNFTLAFAVQSTGRRNRRAGTSVSSQLDRQILNSKNYFKNLFPAIALIVSGGHTILLLMKSLTHYKKLGETRDDAVGEAFDKVARLLNLPYPGGPEIEKLSKYGHPMSVDFPRPMLNQKNYDFSFSGLKTAVLYYLRDFYQKQNYQQIPEVEAEQRGLLRGNTRKRNIRVNPLLKNNNPRESASIEADIAAAFQAAAFDVLISKTLRAAKEFKAKSILISGGVAANKTLRQQFKSMVNSQKSKVIFLPVAKKFCTDNAAMVAVAGYINFLQKKEHRIVAQSNLNL